MNAPELKSLTNPQGETMNDHIICETTEEHSHAVPSTTFINPSVDSVSTSTTATIQGVSGNTYAPMDTSPQPQETRLDQLTTLLNETLKQMVIEITNNKAQPELADTIEQVLTQANWFYDMVKENIEDNHDIESLVDDRVDDRVGSAVDEWFSYNFTLTDHCDIDDIVGDALDDKLESIVEEKLEELLSEKLANAKITVNF
jgi:predicted house-cleaning noncanonical NTP pyrophosphatase (MazG superfamily)